MKVINPNYQSDVAAFAKAKQQAVADYLANNSDKAEISFEQVRSDFPGVADPTTGKAPMTDGTIAAIFAELGYEVVS